MQTLKPISDINCCSEPYTYSKTYTCAFNKFEDNYHIPRSQCVQSEPNSQIIAKYKEYLLIQTITHYKIKVFVDQYLLQPKNGGVAHPIPMTQVKPTAARAWLLSNLKVPKGLQMTTYLSKARTARDQADTNPE